MIEDRVFRGRWSRSSRRDAEVSGTLSISGGDARLELDGRFDEAEWNHEAPAPLFVHEPPREDRIVGHTARGTQITLERSENVRSQFTFPSGYQVTTYRPEITIIGASWPDGEPLTLNEIAISMSDLEAWADASAFEHLPPPPGDPDGPRRHDIAITQPAPTELRLANGHAIVIEHDIHVPGLGGVPTTEATMRHQAWLVHRFPNATPIDDALASIRTLRNLISLGVGRPLTILGVRGHSDHALDRHGTRTQLEILYRMAHNPERPARHLVPHQMLFTLLDIGDRAPEMFETWLARQDVFAPALNLYFGTLYHSTLYLEHRFLGYAQALETYDRLGRTGAKARDPEEHKRVVREIVAAAPAGERRWLKEKLAFSNEITLADRIRHVLGELGEVGVRLVGDGDGFVRRAKDSRNYYTHYDPGLKSKAAFGAALHVLALELQSVLEAALLFDLGFTREEIERILDRVGRFTSLKQWRGRVGRADASGDASHDEPSRSPP